ncbi:MAG TPA: SDR family NAD(P)-dependent oxidoreductase [Acidimicrobiales bacterium]|nr:SDR family NAD(P)-dependent oxidoreductase [Acidimicrobiales bacterium]
MIDATGMPQRAVVLGGGSDLARSLLTALAARRLEAVLLCGRDEQALGAVAEEVRAAGVREVTTAHFDAREGAAADALAALAAERLGTIDLVVVAAGLLGHADLDRLDAAGVAEQLETNFVGPAAAMIAFAKVLRAQGSGVILVYSSVAGLRVRRSNFPYGASKAGLDGFAQGLGDALHGSGVRLVLVRPGFVETKMTAGMAKAPLSATAGRVTADIVAALEGGRSVVTTPKALAPLFALLRLLPRPLWRRLPF